MHRRSIDEIRTLDPETDHRRIACLTSLHEFPWDTTRALEHDLARYEAVPAALLADRELDANLDDPDSPNGAIWRVRCWQSFALARRRRIPPPRAPTRGSSPAPPGIADPHRDGSGQRPWRGRPRDRGPDHRRALVHRHPAGGARRGGRQGRRRRGAGTRAEGGLARAPVRSVAAASRTGLVRLNQSRHALRRRGNRLLLSTA